MKIAIFINTYTPVKNGVVISTSLVRKGLQERGHLVHVFTTRFPGCKPQDGVFRVPGLKLPNVDFALPIYNPFGGWIRRKVLSEGYDVILIEHPFLLGELGLRIAKQLGIPSAFVFHTQYQQYIHYIPLVPERVKLSFLRRHLSHFLRRVDRIIVPSKDFMTEVFSYGAPREKVVHIPNPVDLSKFSPPTPEERIRLRESYGIPKDEKVIGFVGRLAPEKNLGELLEVFKMVLERDGSSFLLLVGGGPEETNLKRLAERLGLSGKVKFTGMLDREKVSEIYKVLDLFVTCSLTEVKPLAYLEALATGVPIIAYDAHGARDTIHQNLNGILVRPGNRSEMVEAILKVLSDRELWERLSQGARETARNYSLEEVSGKYEKLLKELVDDHLKVIRNG